MAVLRNSLGYNSHSFTQFITVMNTNSQNYYAADAKGEFYIILNEFTPSRASDLKTVFGKTKNFFALKLVIRFFITFREGSLMVC